MATAKKTTTPSVASVKATQTALNAKGANLKVDGILGPKTQAAINAYGSTTSSSSKSSTPTSSSTPTPKTTIAPKATSSSSSKSKSSGATSYSTPSTKTAPVQKNKTLSPFNIIGDAIGIGNKNKTVTYKQPKFANPFEGGFFNNLKGGLKSVGTDLKNTFSGKPYKDVGLDASVGNSGFFYDKRGSDYQIPVDTPKINENPQSPAEIVGNYAKNFGSNVKELVSPTQAPGQPDPKQFTGLEANGGPMGYESNLNPGVTVPTPQSGGSSSPEVTSKIVTPLADGSTQTSSFNSPTPSVNISPTISANVTGLTDSFLKNTTDPFQSEGTKGEFQKNKIVQYESDVAKQFTSSQQAMSEYQNNPGFQASINKAAAKANKTPQEMLNNIAAKVQNGSNGVIAPQTVPEYLKNVSGVSPEMTKILNQQIAENSNYTQAQKDILFGKKDADGNDIIKGMVQQAKDEADRATEFYERQLARQEKTIREKAQLEIDKKKAEFDSEDAELELKRITAKENLVNFLAHIGALNTDGNAIIGIEKLEQAYQAQRQSLRQSFEFAERGIRSDMNERMGQLQDGVDEKKFKLSQDLSKTEREVMLEGMKLDHEFNKDMSTIRLKYASEIQDAKEKATAKADALANDNIEKVRALMAGGAAYEEAIKLVSGKNYANDSKSLARVNQLLGTKDTDKAAIADLQELDAVLNTLKGAKKEEAIVKAKKLFLQDFPNQSALFNSYIGN
jgi:hypothetical protein